MRFLLTGRDLCDVFWHAKPFNLITFDRYLRSGGHRLVLSYATVRSLMGPLENEADFLRVKPTLEACERLPHLFLDSVGRIEIQTAINAFSTGIPYRDPGVFVGTFQGGGSSIAEYVECRFRERPQNFGARSFAASIEHVRSEFEDLKRRRAIHLQFPNISWDSDHRDVPPQRTLRLAFSRAARRYGMWESWSGIHLKSIYKKGSRIESRFDDWLYSNPDYCLGFQLSYETEIALSEKCADLAVAPDSELSAFIPDRYHVMALPYCDAATFGSAILQSCSIGADALAARGAKMRVEKKLFSGLTALVAEIELDGMATAT